MFKMIFMITTIVCIIDFYIFYNFNIYFVQTPIRFYQKYLFDMRFAFVSCFFPIKNGKIRHTINDYQMKASKIFKVFPESMLLFIFTSTEGKKILEHAKNINNSNKYSFLNIKIIEKYQSVFDIPQISKYKPKYEEISKIMNQQPLYKNNKKNISAEIGSIWNSKIIFLKEIIEQNIYAKLIFWIDIGIFKNDEYFYKDKPLIWPSIERIEKIFQHPSNSQYVQKILFWANPQKIEYKNSLNNINLNDYDVFIHAAFFGGPRQIFLNFLNDYWKIHDIFIKQNQFVLREEFIFAVYLMLNWKNAFFINMGGSKCYFFHSSIGFISKFNICNFKNELFIFTKRGKYLRPVYYTINSWL